MSEERTGANAGISEHIEYKGINAECSTLSRHVEQNVKMHTHTYTCTWGNKQKTTATCLEGDNDV